MQKGGKLADASTFLAASRYFFLDIFHVFFIVLPFFPVPPPTPAIFDESGQEAKTVVGPYMEGDSVVLKCISSGGEFQIQFGHSSEMISDICLNEVGMPDQLFTLLCS